LVGNTTGAFDWWATRLVCLIGGQQCLIGGQHDRCV